MGVPFSTLAMRRDFLNDIRTGRCFRRGIAVQSECPSFASRSNWTGAEDRRSSRQRAGDKISDESKHAKLESTIREFLTTRPVQHPFGDVLLALSKAQRLQRVGPVVDPALIEARLLSKADDIPLVEHSKSLQALLAMGHQPSAAYMEALQKRFVSGGEDEFHHSMVTSLLRSFSAIPKMEVVPRLFPFLVRQLVTLGAVRTLNEGSLTSIFNSLAKLQLFNAGLVAAIVGRCNYVSARASCTFTPKDVCLIVAALAAFPQFVIPAHGLDDVLRFSYGVRGSFSPYDIAMFFDCLSRLESPEIPAELINGFVAAAFASIHQFKAIELQWFSNALYRFHVVLSEQDLASLLGQIEQVAPTLSCVNIQHIVTALSRIAHAEVPFEAVSGLIKQTISKIDEFSASSLASNISGFSKFCLPGSLKPLFHAYEVASLGIISEFSPRDICSYIYALSRFCPTHTPSSQLLFALDQSLLIAARDINPKGLVMVFRAFVTFALHAGYHIKVCLKRLTLAATNATPLFASEDIVRLIMDLSRLSSASLRPKEDIITLIAHLLRHSTSFSPSPIYCANLLRAVALMEYHLPDNAALLSWSIPIQDYVSSSVPGFSHHDHLMALRALNTIQNRSPLLVDALQALPPIDQDPASFELDSNPIDDDDNDTDR